MMVGSILLVESPNFPKAKTVLYSPLNEFCFLLLPAVHGLAPGIHAEGVGSILAAISKSFLSSRAGGCTKSVQAHEPYLHSEKAHASGSVPHSLVLAS